MRILLHLAVVNVLEISSGLFDEFMPIFEQNSIPDYVFNFVLLKFYQYKPQV